MTKGEGGPKFQKKIDDVIYERPIRIIYVCTNLHLALWLYKIIYLTFIEKSKHLHSTNFSSVFLLHFALIFEVDHHIRAKRFKSKSLLDISNLHRLLRSDMPLNFKVYFFTSLRSWGQCANFFIWFEKNLPYILYSCKSNFFGCGHQFNVTIDD